MSRKHKKRTKVVAVNMHEKKSYSYTPKVVCHTGPIEIIPNFFLARLSEALKLPALGVSTLVPLDSLYGDIWDTGFRGEIIYCPVEDFCALPDDVLDYLVQAIMDRLANGVKVGLFCMGGHGRTGYVAAVVLGKLGYEDPIGFLRLHYCKSAVETNAQIKHIAHVLNAPELYSKYEKALDVYAGLYSFGSLGYSKPETLLFCKDCKYKMDNGECELYGCPTWDYMNACDEGVRKLQLYKAWPSGFDLD